MFILYIMPRVPAEKALSHWFTLLYLMKRMRAKKVKNLKTINQMKLMKMMIKNKKKKKKKMKVPLKTKTILTIRALHLQKKGVALKFQSSTQQRFCHLIQPVVQQLRFHQARELLGESLWQNHKVLVVTL